MIRPIGRTICAWGQPASASVATILFLILVNAALASPLIGRPDILDGDTIEIQGQLVHLYGIDAPEREQTCLDGDGITYPCGEKAARVLASRIGIGGIVFCDPDDRDRQRGRQRDRQGRLIAVCHARGRDLSAWMAGLGWALADRTHGDRYLAAEKLARDRGYGQWEGLFIPPWEWRKER